MNRNTSAQTFEKENLNIKIGGIGKVFLLCYQYHKGSEGRKAKGDKDNKTHHFLRNSFPQ